jgi:hypothetical protein
MTFSEYTLENTPINATWRKIRINLPSRRYRGQSISRKNSGTSSRKT